MSIRSDSKRDILYLGGIFLIFGIMVGSFLSVYFSSRILPPLQQYGLIESPPTYTPYPTYTPFPIETSIPMPVELPNSPSASPVIGSKEKPVPIGKEHIIPGYGEMTVVGAYTPSGESGLAIVYLSFVCKLPQEQLCDTTDFILEAIGASGNVYLRDFSPEIPRPGFGTLGNSEIHGGESTEGFAGFMITQPEPSLILHVSVFLHKDIEAFFQMSR